MKRFYKTVAIAGVQGGYLVTLDGRAIKTALGNPQIVPTRALAEALAQEWRDQGEEIDPALFHFRDLADFAIDMIAPDPAPHIAKLLDFLETDTLCYRAEPDEPSVRRQEEVWEPLITAFAESEGVPLERICSIIHRQQPPESMDRLRTRLATIDPFTLAALLTMTSLAASLVVGLSALDQQADPEPLWAAANLEEDWQIEQWGQDADAATVRERRTEGFMHAARFAGLVDQTG